MEVNKKVEVVVDKPKNSIEKYTDIIKQKLEEIRKRNYNDYTNSQDGNEVKESIIREIMELL